MNELGYDDAIYGVIGIQHFHINATKETYYTMTFMTTYGTLERSGNKRKRRVNVDTVWFRYLDIFWNHYTYQHYVDDHNNCR